MEDFDRSIQEKSGNLTVSHSPAYHMWLSTRDMARIGELMLRKGRWNGTQLVPEDWVERTTSVITPLEEAEYVYLVQERKLIEVYNNDNNLDSHCEPQEGEPGLYFHEFIFLRALIALNAESLAEVPVPH